MKGPESYSFLYVLGGFITCLCSYSDIKMGRRFPALGYFLGGLALIFVGIYWWLYGGRF